MLLDNNDSFFTQEELMEVLDFADEMIDDIDFAVAIQQQERLDRKEARKEAKAAQFQDFVLDGEILSQELKEIECRMRFTYSKKRHQYLSRKRTQVREMIHAKATATFEYVKTELLFPGMNKTFRMCFRDVPFHDVAFSIQAYPYIVDWFQTSLTLDEVICHGIASRTNEETFGPNSEPKPIKSKPLF